jgi:hypothetical protein
MTESSILPLGRSDGPAGRTEEAVSHADEPASCSSGHRNGAGGHEAVHWGKIIGSRAKVVSSSTSY